MLYLQRIDPTQLPSIFKSSLTPALLAAVLRAVLSHVAQGSASGAAEGGDQAWALAVVGGLAACPRFDMTSMCIGSKGKKALSALWEAGFQGAEGEAEELRKKLKL